MGRRRWALAAVAFAATAAAVVPRPSAAVPSQEEPGGSGEEDALVAIDVEVADGDAVALTGAIDDLESNVGVQLRQLADAEAAIQEQLTILSATDTAIQVTQTEIDDLTGSSDSLVVTRFMNPPAEEAVESLTAESVADATVKQALLQMRADADAEELAHLREAREVLETQRDQQEQIKVDAAAARIEAEAALEDVQAAVGQQTRFVLDIEAWLADPEGAAQLGGDSPDDATHRASVIEELTARISALELAEQAEEARQAAEEARQRLLRGGFTCPIDGRMSFRDSWGEPRSGGARRHRGTDMSAANGTPVVAPDNGRVVHGSDTLGGLTFRLYSDDGHMYYGAHLSRYENRGIGWVKAGTLIGRVGETGNAVGAHLHFQYHPQGGDPVNPFPRLAEVCPRS